MGPNFVYFDLETQRSANDVGGWDKKADMLMSVGVTYSTRRGTYKIYPENEVLDLIDELLNADLVIGYNHLHFDYEVLMGYDVRDLKAQTRNLDMLLDLANHLEHRPKLEAVASASLGQGKSAVGTDAIKWWRQGKYREVAQYCCYDVKVTKGVHEYGARNGRVAYVNRFNHRDEVAVNWTLPSCQTS
jgi:hypothetical protein